MEIIGGKRCYAQLGCKGYRQETPAPLDDGMRRGGYQGIDTTLVKKDKCHSNERQLEADVEKNHWIGYEHDDGSEG